MSATPAHAVAARPGLPSAAARRAVRYDGTISPGARLLYADVCELAEISQGNGHGPVALARPETYAERFDVSLKTVQRWLTELRGAGLVESRPLESDRRRRGLAPLAPPEYPSEVRDISGESPSEMRANLDESPSESRGIGADLPEYPSEMRATSKMSLDSEGEIPLDSVPTPGVITPQRGVSGARAHEGTREEGSRDSASTDRAGDGEHAPTLGQVLAVAAKAGVAAPVAEQFFYHFDAQGWVTGGKNPRPIRRWQSKLMQWREQQRVYDRRDAAGTPGAGQTGGTMRDLTDLIDA